MIIAIASFPGTNSKNIAKSLALQLSLRCVNEGDFLINQNSAVETIDEVDKNSAKEKIQAFISKEAKKGGIIFNHSLSGWLLPEADVKIFLNSVKKNRAKKMLKKMNVPLIEALKKIEDEEKKKSGFLLSLFGFDLYDLSVYDLVINVDKIEHDAIIALIRKFIEKVKT